jgi:hypothetical protein
MIFGKGSISWDITLYGPSKVSRHFEESIWPPSLELKSKRGTKQHDAEQQTYLTSVDFQLTLWPRIPEDRICYRHCESVRSTDVKHFDQKYNTLSQ